MAAQCLARSLLKGHLATSIRHVNSFVSVARSSGRLGLPSVGAPGVSAGSRVAGRRMVQRSAATGGGGGGSSGGGKPVGSGGSGDSSGSGGSGGGLWGWYMSCLEANPLITKALTCALLNALGDVFCQLWIEGGKWDAHRTGVFTFMGLVLVGPTLHVWYSVLNKLVKGATLQLLLDQGVFAPCFLSLFIAVLFTIEGKSDQIVPKLKQDLVETVKVNWILWIPAQYLNFRYVPPNLQVLVANIVALVWNTYMSFQSHKVVAPAGGAVAEPAPAAPAPKGGKKK